MKAVKILYRKSWKHRTVLHLPVIFGPHDSVIRFTAHFITDKFIRGQCLLQASKFNEWHTGDNIASIYSDCVSECKIESKVVCGLRDGGSNFVAGYNRSGVPSITCLTHSLQHVIHDDVLAQKDVQDLLASGRRIVGHYKHSNVAFHLLQRIQAQLELKVCAGWANQVEQQLLHVKEACGAKEGCKCC